MRKRETIGTWVSDKAWENLLDLAGDGGDDVVAELVGIFQKQAQTWLQDLRAAVKKQDTSGIEALCHSLKSSAAGVGATGLSALCAEIELAAHHRKISWSSPSFVDIEQALTLTSRELAHRLADRKKNQAA